MAEITEAVEESSSYPEAETSDPKEQTLSIEEREKTPCQLEDKEMEKIRKILRKVKLARKLTMERRNKGRKSIMLVFYYRRGKKKNENQPKKD